MPGKAAREAERQVKKKGTRSATTGRSTRKVTRRSRSKSAQAARGKRTTRATTKRAKKARLYTRYDPASGKKYRVTADDWRYAEWSNRKPSKRAKLQEKILSQPGEYISERASRVGTEIARKSAGTIARKALPASAAVAGRILASAAFAPLASLTALAIGAALLERRSVGNARLALGERINNLSREFVAAQQQMAAEYRVAHFGDVPAEARNRLLAGYKTALARLTAATKVTTYGRFGPQTYSTIGR